MALTKTLEDIISEQASIVCEQIEAAVAFADSEEDLRIEVEKAIEVFRKEADLPELKGHHEVTIGKGRADSVYDYVFIEYKKPGRLKESNDTPGNREVIKQLQDRAKAFKSELKRDPKELFGVGTDGNYFITGRYRSGKWEISAARERSVYVVEDFLRKLSSLGVAGKPFLPEYLAGDFGAESERKLAREGIEKLYWRIREVEKDPDTYPKAKVLFDQWRILFGEVCGYDIKTPSSKVKQLGEFYGVKKDPNPAALLFSVHSYYALFMKFLAAEIATMFSTLSTSFLARLHQTGSSEKLREELRVLEDGGIYRQLGIKNFLEGDLFSWYLDAWDTNVEKIIRQMVACLDEYDPKTLSIDPVESRDLLKKLYQQLFPKTVRHDLGEYYTPDWLAELVIERVGYDGNPDKRVLDPACGSGTFLVMAINKVREYADKHMIPKHELLSKILNNIVGFDLNPLAVMAARTNYLLSLRELLKLGGEIEIPVYLCDSIMTPAEYGGLITKDGIATGGIGTFQELKTSAARFMIPTEIAQSRQTVSAYADELEHCIRNDYSENDFIIRLKGEGIPVDSEELHKTLYRQVLKLKKQNQNDIWARIIKNSFAPLFIGRGDYVIGNPPWIAWLNLPEGYRQDTALLWQKYHIFPHKGLKARLGSAKDDISILFTYVSADRYLTQMGRLGFVVTQTLFKSKGGGQGFRRFRLGNDEHLGVTHVDDLVAIQPFEGATNRTALICLTKGVKTKEEVDYVVWTKKKGQDISPDSNYETVLRAANLEKLTATPIDSSDPTSAWLTGKGVSLKSISRLIGKSDYKARMGACFGSTGVYWINTLSWPSRNKVLVKNVGGGKKHISQTTASIESHLVYPILRGKDLRRWISQPEISVIMPQNPEKRSLPMSLAEMKRDYPLTLSYMKKFEPLLRSCGIFQQFFDSESDPFYALYNVGDYTYAPWKVLWRQVSNTLDTVVVGKHQIEAHEPPKPVIPDHSLCSISFSNNAEAHYVCALLNSVMARFIVKNYCALHPSPHIMEYIPVTRFASQNSLHQRLSELSEKCHRAASKGEDKVVKTVESDIDVATAELWGIDPTELTQIKKALKED